MANYYTLKSGNLHDPGLLGIAHSEITSCSAAFVVPAANEIRVNSTAITRDIFLREEGIRAISLPVLSCNNTSGATFDLTMKSGSYSSVYTFPINSFFSNSSVDVLSDQIIQNINTLYLDPPFFPPIAEDPVSLTIKTSQPDTLTLFGNIDIIDGSLNNIPLYRTKPRTSVANISGRFLNSTSVLLNNKEYYRDTRYFTYYPNISTNDFTIEAWIYPLTRTSGNNGIIVEFGSISDTGSSLAGKRIRLSQCAGGTENLGFIIPTNISTADRIVASTSAARIPLSAWSHVALTRKLSSCFCFYNGTLVASATAVDFDFMSNDPGLREFKIGGENNTGTPFDGYISDLRILANTALYTGNFTVPTAPPTINEYTIFHLSTGINLNRSLITLTRTDTHLPVLLNNNGITIADNIGNVNKSLHFNESAGFERRAYFFNLSSNFAFTTNIYLTSLPDSLSSYSLFSYGYSSRNFAVPNLNLIINNNSIQVLNRNRIIATFPCVLSQNVWNNIGLLKINNRMSCAVNGNIISSGNIPALINYPYLEADTDLNIITHIGRFYKGYLAYASLVGDFTLFYNESANYIKQSGLQGIIPYSDQYRKIFITEKDNTMTYNVAFRLPKEIDDLHVSNCVQTVNNTNPSTSYTTVSVANNVTLSGNLYIHNNASLNFISNSNIIDVRGDTGIIINSNGTLNIASYNAPANSASKIYLFTNGINVNNNGNLNIYGSPKIPGVELLSSSPVNVRTFTTTISNLSTLWLSGDTLCFVPNFTASVSPNPTFETALLSSFGDNNSFTTNVANQFAHPANILMPAVLNLSRDVIIRPLLSTNRTYLVANDSSNININGAEFSLVGNTLLRQNGIIINTNQYGSFILNNCTVSAASVNVGGGSLGKLQSVFVSNTFLDNEYSLYLPPAGTSYISPLFSTLPFLTENFTIDGWFYDLGENTNGAIINWRDGVSTYNYLGFRVFRASNNRIGVVISSNINTVQNEKYSKPNVFLPNVWHHISIVNKNNFLTIYVDGVDVGCGGRMDNMKPYGLYPLSAAATTSNYIRIGGSTTSTAASEYFGGYMYDFRINLSEAIPPRYPSLTSPNLATDIFRLSRSSTITDVSPLSSDIFRNSTSFMAKFYPKAHILNNIQLKDNIFIAGTREGITLCNTKLQNSLITGNYVLSSLYQNYKFYNLELTNTLIQNNYATSPRLDDIESLFISNCSGVDLCKIGGVYTFNSAATGAIVTGKNNNIIVNNVGCLCCLDDCLIIDSSDYLLDNTLFTNITSISSFKSGIKIIDQNYILPHFNTYSFTKINLNNAFLSSNNIGIEAYNVGGVINNIYAADNRKGLYCSLGNNNTYINNFTALQTRNISTVCLQIVDNNKRGVLYMNNCLLTSTTSRPHSSLVLDNDFALLNISNTNISVTAFSSVFAPDKPLRGYYEFNNCNFAVSAITALSAFVVPDSLRILGLTHTNYNNLTGNYITYISNGNVSSDKSTSIQTLTLTPSERVVPRNRYRKAKSSSKFVAIGPETTSATISVQVHTSDVAENADYNGDNPRLILKANPLALIEEDTVLATLPLNSSTRGKFTTLSASIPLVQTDTIYEFYVDCDGNRGWINVDNWQAT